MQSRKAPCIALVAVGRKKFHRPTALIHFLLLRRLQQRLLAAPLERLRVLALAWLFGDATCDLPMSPGAGGAE